MVVCIHLLFRLQTCESPPGIQVYSVVGSVVLRTSTRVHCIEQSGLVYAI